MDEIDWGRGRAEDWEVIEAGLVIDENHGLNLVFENGCGSRLITVLGEAFPRKATLVVDSYVGISLGAKHAYGRISIYGPPVQFLEASEADAKFHKAGDVASISGSIDQYKPREALGLEIILTRPTLAIEAGLDSFKYARPGDPTECFHTKDAVIARAKEVFRSIFHGRWVLVRRYHDGILCYTEESNG